MDTPNLTPNDVDRITLAGARKLRVTLGAGYVPANIKEARSLFLVSAMEFADAPSADALQTMLRASFWLADYSPKAVASFLERRAEGLTQKEESDPKGRCLSLQVYTGQDVMCELPDGHKGRHIGACGLYEWSSAK